MIKQATKVNSPAEDLFVQLFCEVFGPEKADNLYVQHPFVDIYGNHRAIDFALESEDTKVAIEIDGETYHNPKKVSENKYFDDLLKQNSLIHQDWKVFRWAYHQLKNQAAKVKDELVTFLGDSPFFKVLETFLPRQCGKVFELREHQAEALKSLQQMRENGETIALLYHATGIGKTVTAASDAKAVDGRTLFLVNALKLADQAEQTFDDLWPEASRGQFTGSSKTTDTKIVFATVQSICKSLNQFPPDDFDYIIIDECHHSTAQSYKKILGFFKPKFILGLTATPERTDGNDLLELFQNIAHKMDLKAAVEKGELVPIRCFRIKTDIDLSTVRINGIKYYSQDLESKLFVPERNNLIADTYVNYVRKKKTVIFCASVDHADEMARLLKSKGIVAESINGSDRVDVRNKILSNYESGDINVLCACDLLNEGWDSPKTEVLFMARPTMSKTIYMQQLGRGTRKCEGKEELLVFDFVDNANMFNRPYSCHRLLSIAEYRPGQYVLASEAARQKDWDLFFKGEKPTQILEMPIDINDFELVDLFQWQEKVKDMISELEFVRMVNVQSETISNYIRSGKLVADYIVDFSESRKFHYFHEDTVKKYCVLYGWTLITPSNMKDMFIEFIKKMDMSYSYKPVLLKATLEHIDEDGRARLCDIVDYFIEYYTDRKGNGLVVEKSTSIYCKEDFTRKEVEANVLSNPFKRFADMRFLQRCRDIENIEVHPYIFSKLTSEDRAWINSWCDKKLTEYYRR